MKDPVFDVFGTITFYLHFLNTILNNFNPPETVFQNCFREIYCNIVADQSGFNRKSATIIGGLDWMRLFIRNFCR